MKPCPLSNFDAAFAATPDPVDPRDFIRPDGSYDVSPLNLGERKHVEAVQEFVAGNKEVTR